MKTLKSAVLVCLVATNAWATGEIVYVQAAKTELKVQPQMNATAVTPLTRGNELQVLEKKDPWFRVSFQGKEGWISRLFTSSHKPVGHATLNQEVQVSLEKASRRRSSSYSVTASTRGLNADERVRQGRELFRPDYDALERLEAFELKEGSLMRFKQSGNLE